MRRLLPVPLLLLLLSACSTIPAETEKGRGVLSGVNLVLGLSVLVFVVAIGAILGALALDRVVRNRRALADGGPVVEDEEEEEEQDEIVAGIGVGRAAVPRWLYLAYGLIPLFAFAYVFTNMAPAQTEDPVETAAPAGPCEECEITAQQIVFDKDVIQAAAGAQITVTFHNEDAGVPHDWTVFPTKAAFDAQEEPTSTTGQIGGGATKAAPAFEGPAAGETFFFICTIHPASMFGDVEGV